MGYGCHGVTALHYRAGFVGGFQNNFTKPLAGWENVCNFAVSEMTNPVLSEWE